MDYSTFGEEYLDIASNLAKYCDLIWFRAKELTARDMFTRAARLRKALPDNTLVLSEHADAAHMLGYNGVHLGELTMPVDAVREAFPNLIIGYSAHSAEDCHENADYYTLSPVFPTPKPYKVTPLGAVPAPCANVYALGGINADNISSLKGLGYKGVAGISFYRDMEKIYEKSLLL